MDNFETNEIKIANYLEDKMSAAEEQAFMQALDSDEELRRQYEEELLVRVLLGENEASGQTAPGATKEPAVIKNMMFQPADEHVGMIGAAMEKKSIYRPYKLAAAAAVILLIAGTVVFELANKRTPPVKAPEVVKNSGNIRQVDSPKIETTVKGGTPKDTVKNIPKDLRRKNNPGGGGDVLAGDNGAAADRLFADFYTGYSAEERQPKELAAFYSDYQTGNYDAVISATEADYLTGESESRNHTLKQYMELYKGLSWLVKDSPQTDKALEQFHLVMQSSHKTDLLYYDAQWYSALAYIRKGDLTKVSGIVSAIHQSASPYAAKAVALQKRLKALPSP